MVKGLDLKQYEQTTRREALLSITAGKTVICQMRKNDFSEITNMAELEEVVNAEQRGLCDSLKFYKRKN